MIHEISEPAKRFALATAVGLLLGGTSLTPARAADLGGDCCADLEERVAELEATTARKGNRKVSLKISGQVNKYLLIWDDGEESDAYVLDNEQSSTRFRFTGSAAIRPGWSAGYYLEWDSRSARSGAANQVNFQNGNSDIRLRHAVWWIKSDKLGSLWVGQHSTATDNLYLLSLGGAGVASSGDPGLNGAGFLLRTSGVAGNAGLIGTQTWGDFLPSFDSPRADIIRYDSPSIAGCVLSASWGENDLWDVAARCKKELNSIKILFGIGYIERQDETSFTATTVNERRETDDFIVSGSILHDPSGLFISGFYAQREFAANSSGLTCIAAAGCADVDTYYVQLGVFRRWNDLGKTSIFVDYQEFDDANAGTSAAGFASGNAVIASSDTEVYGVGIVQYVDAAAMELYADYHHFELDVATDAIGGGNRVNENLEDFDRVILGARIKF